MNDRTATTSVPIHPPIAARWSPRAFSDEGVADGDLVALLEAARWAPSCFGAEPWRFVIGVKGRGDGYAKILGCLVEGNQKWARSAPVLMITIGRERFEFNDEENAWHAHDVGLAMGQLAIEAATRGLVVHQMGGFDQDAAREALAIPEGYRPIAACAIGHQGDPADLPDELRAKETAPRERKPLNQIAFEGAFGDAFRS